MRNYIRSFNDIQNLTSNRPDNFIKIRQPRRRIMHATMADSNNCSATRLKLLAVVAS